MGALAGYRTKILAAGTILTTIAGIMGGTVEIGVGIPLILAAIGTLTARAPGAEAKAKIDGK